MSKKPHILIIYTGGTIGMVKSHESNVLQPFDFEHLYKSIPELRHLHCSIEHISFEEPIDSSDMTPRVWQKILNMIEANYDRVDGFVILHGSDTMAYSASAMSFMIENLDKPIIFTGSQLPIGDLRTDAKENMITALEIAASRTDDNQSVIKEVCVYFEYKLYRGNRTTKISAAQFRAFESPNHPILAESGVDLMFNPHAFFEHSTQSPPVFRPLEEHPILLLKLHPGLTPEVLNHQLATPNLKGVILETYGSGNAPTYSWFLEALHKTLKAGIPVIDITQCFAGGVVLGKYQSSLELRNMGLVNGKDITTEAAVTKLMYLLTITDDLRQIKELFETPLRGEIKQ
ncbi:MAG: L-asparaginase 1 [Flavobacteriia bacterium]|nr:MAG: L-asparaginase 1 [Flavobacteriia bacterium]